MMTPFWTLSAKHEPALRFRKKKSGRRRRRSRENDILRERQEGEGRGRRLRIFNYLCSPSPQKKPRDVPYQHSKNLSFRRSDETGTLYGSSRQAVSLIWNCLFSLLRIMRMIPPIVVPAYNIDTPSVPVTVRAEIPWRKLLLPSSFMLME